MNILRSDPDRHCSRAAEHHHADCDHNHCKSHDGSRLANGMSCKSNSDCESHDCDHNKCKGH